MASEISINIFSHSPIVPGSSSFTRLTTHILCWCFYAKMLSSYSVLCVQLETFNVCVGNTILLLLYLPTILCTQTKPILPAIWDETYNCVWWRVWILRNVFTIFGCCKCMLTQKKRISIVKKVNGEHATLLRKTGEQFLLSASTTKTFIDVGGFSTYTFISIVNTV